MQIIFTSSTVSDHIDILRIRLTVLKGKVCFYLDNVVFAQFVSIQSKLCNKSILGEFGFFKETEGLSVPLYAEKIYSAK